MNQVITPGITEAERNEVRAIMVAGKPIEVTTVDLILNRRVGVAEAGEVAKIMKAGTARPEAERENPHVDSRAAGEGARQSVQKSGPLTAPKPTQSPAVPASVRCAPGLASSDSRSSRHVVNHPVRRVRRSFYAFGPPGEPYPPDAPPPKSAA